MTLLVEGLPTLHVPTARDQRQQTGARRMLVLALVLLPGEFDGRVGHVIPRVVDADEQEQYRCRSDAEECRCRMDWEQKRRDDEDGVGDERQDGMPQPVFQHWLIAHLTASCPQEHDDDIGHSPETRKAEQQASVPERLPRRTE